MRSLESVPEMLDLHGCTVHEGWKLFNEYIGEAAQNNKKSVTVITGRGQMNREFKEWVMMSPLARDCDEYEQGGSWRVRLKR